MAGCSGKNSGKEDNKGSTAGTSSANVNKTGFPIVNQPIKLKMFAMKSPPNGPYANMMVFQEYAKKTNINVEWNDVPTEALAEKKNLLFAANDLPDALFKAGITPLESIKYGTSGVLIPLEKLIDAYAPNVKKLLEQYPEIKPSITAPDGHIYALPTIVPLASARTPKSWLNMTWMKKLNLSVPKTTDELVDVLKAFRDKDPNGNGKPDEIPMSMRNWAQLLDWLSGSWGLDDQMGYQINIDNDKVHIWLTDDRYKEYLQYLNGLYKEKLLDQDLFLQKPSDYTGKMASGRLGFFGNQASDTFQKFKNEYAGIAPLKGPHGDQMYHANSVIRGFGEFAITKADKYPEATLRWVDYFYGDEGSIFFRYGIEGKTFTYQKDGTPQYSDEILKDPKGINVAIGKFTPWPGGGAPHVITEKNGTAVNPPEVQAAEKQLDPYLPKKILDTPLFDEATAKKVDTLRQDIDTYVSESAAKFVMGKDGFDKWDNYVSTLKKMGLDQLQTYYQDAYDKSYKNK
jgi:putative aldouronate transport system substrate-binding protein